MEQDVSTREGARRWLGRRVRKLGLVLLVSIIATPFACALVVGVRGFRALGEIPPIGPLVVPILMWTVIMIAIIFLVAGIIGAKYIRFARRVRPIIDRGHERAGAVVEVQHSRRKGGGVNHHKITLTVGLNDGATVTASLEEMEGTALPVVEVGAPAVAWSIDQRAVVGTSGSLFEAA